MYFDSDKGAKKTDSLFTSRGVIIMLVVLAVFVGLFFLANAQN